MTSADASLTPPEEGSYDADALDIFHGLAPVRFPRGMYVGSADSRGLNHCVWELVDNAVDEALARCCSKITVILHADGFAEVVDDGGGIPMGINAVTGLPGVEVVFTKLHGRDKFAESNCKTSGGLYGVGVGIEG